jgi:hypothetical protein
MRKRSGRGGKGAWLKQKELRDFCFRNHIRQVDLSVGAYDWRLLLKTMPSLRTKTVIGRGVISFQFRLLDLIDANYLIDVNHRWGRWRFYRPEDGYERHVEDMGERHVFEMCCADGIRWHMHFHRNGSCDLMRWSHETSCGDETPTSCGDEHPAGRL